MNRNNLINKKIDLGSTMSLYDINKDLMKNYKAMNNEEVYLKVKSLIKPVITEGVSYIMLLCNDRRDYTVFQLGANGFDLDFLAENLVGCIHDRGLKILSIELTDTGNAFEIWVRDDKNVNFVYYFFDYSQGVIKVPEE